MEEKTQEALLPWLHSSPQLQENFQTHLCNDWVSPTLAASTLEGVGFSPHPASESKVVGQQAADKEGHPVGHTVEPWRFPLELAWFGQNSDQAPVLKRALNPTAGADACTVEQAKLRVKGHQSGRP